MHALRKPQLQTFFGLRQLSISNANLLKAQRHAPGFDVLRNSVHVEFAGVHLEAMARV